MKHYDTQALQLVKRKLLAGHKLTQAGILKATSGQAWRLSAAIYTLGKAGWAVARYTDGNKHRVYYLKPKEKQRIQQEMKT